RHGGRWVDESPHQLVHLRGGRGIERGKGNARNLRIAEKDSVSVHIDGGLQLDGPHHDVALAACWRQGKRHTRVDLLVVGPVVNLRLIKNYLSAWLGDLARPAWVLCPDRSNQQGNQDKQQQKRSPQNARAFVQRDMNSHDQQPSGHEPWAAPTDARNIMIGRIQGNHPLRYPTTIASATRNFIRNNLKSRHRVRPSGPSS